MNEQNNNNINLEETNNIVNIQENNNDNSNLAQKQKKKKHPLLIGCLSILVIIAIPIIVGIILAFRDYHPPFESGQIQILDKTIQLPCKITEFEEMFNTKIYFMASRFATVSLLEGDLLLEVYAENNMIKSIRVKIYSSSEERDYFISRKNERYMANKIVFPGNITSDSKISEIREKYSLKPIISMYENSFEHSDGVIDYWYKTQEWYIEFKIDDGEITEIYYRYDG